MPIVCARLVRRLTDPCPQTDDDGRPVTFILSEHRYRPLRIEQHWEWTRSGGDETGRVWHRYVTAPALEGVLVVLFFHVLRDGWYLEGVHD